MSAKLQIALQTIKVSCQVHKYASAPLWTAMEFGMKASVGALFMFNTADSLFWSFLRRSAMWLSYLTLLYLLCVCNIMVSLLFCFVSCFHSLHLGCLLVIIVLTLFQSL